MRNFTAELYKLTNLADKLECVIFEFATEFRNTFAPEQPSREIFNVFWNSSYVGVEFSNMGQHSVVYVEQFKFLDWVESLNIDSVQMFYDAGY